MIKIGVVESNDHQNEGMIKIMRRINNSNSNDNVCWWQFNVIAITIAQWVNLAEK